MSRALTDVAFVAEQHGYRMGECKIKHKRVLGRGVLVPCIDQSKYLASAKIDTLVVRASFESHKQERHVSNNLATKLGVNRPWIDKDKATSTLVSWDGDITFQDFPCDQLHNLAGYDEFLPWPEIIQMDIAIDFRSKADDLSVREIENNDILDVMARHLWVDRSLTELDAGMPRLVWGRGKAASDKMRHSTARLGSSQPHFIPAGATAYIGARDATTSYKLYHKKTDQRRDDEVFTKLTPSEWVARCEVTIKQAALRELGVIDLQSLARFKFKKLTPLFCFRLPTCDLGDGASEFIQMVKETRSKILLGDFLLAGMSEYRKREQGIDPRNKYGYSVAYTELNERVRNVLRRLN